MEYGARTILVEIQGTSMGLISDTGSTIFIVEPGVSRSDVHVTAVEPYGVTGDALDVTWQQSVTFRMNGSSRTQYAHSLPRQLAYWAPIILSD